MDKFIHFYCFFLTNARQETINQSKEKILLQYIDLNKQS